MTTDDSPDLPDGRRTRWHDHNQARRQVIIDAAITVMQRQAPGEDVQVQAVADEAGMSRTVIYRHFEDRADLDRAVQRQICADIGNQLLPALVHDGTPEQIIHGMVESFVGWAVAHPTLYWFAERDLSGWGTSPLGQAISEVAEQIEAIMSTVVAYLGFELDADDTAGLDPWVFALMGAILAGVRRWLERDVREPSAERFIEIISESIWVQINGMALTRGLNLQDLNVTEMLQAFGDDETARG